MDVKSSEIFYLRGVHAFATCGVPIFFLLAGYYLVYKDDWNYRNNLKKKFKSLVIPYLGFISIYAVINCGGSLVFVTHKLFIRVFELLFSKVHVPFAVGLIVTCVGTIAGCSLAALFINRFLPILVGHIPNKKGKRLKEA